MDEIFNPLLTELGGESGFGEIVLQRNDDDSSTELDLPFSINFFGNNYQTFFVNNNGNITFNDRLSESTPEAFPIAQQPLIAAYWADIDTRNENSGLVYLAIPNDDTVVITYDSVGYFERQANLLNTFQIVLRDTSEATGNPGDFEIEFRYQTLEWTTGDGSDGINGLGGIAAQAGFDAGNLQNFFSLPGSFSEEVLELQNTSNVSEATPGLWSFAIREETIPGSSPSNPIIPVITEEGFEFDFNIPSPDDRIWIDPEIAIGYDYIINSGPNITSIEIPVDFSGDDGVYDIFFPNAQGELVDSNLDLAVNETFSFVDNGFPEGITSFGIRGIDEEAQLSPDDPQAFVTGLQFASAGAVNLNQNPVVIDVDVPALIAISVFTVDDEGWTIAGDANNLEPNYFNTGGNPEGYINFTDSVAGDTWYFNAPNKFLGDVSNALGGTLSYSLRQRGDGANFDAPDVILNGAGLQLVLEIPSIPTDPDWTSYNIDLNTSADWRVDSLQGELATEEQLQTVLSDLTQLRIRGEFLDGSDNGDLDNVVLTGLTNTPVLDAPLFRFRNDNVSGTYLFAGQEESQSVRQNFSDVFTEEGEAFKVSLQADDDLVRFNRFSNNQVQGTYLYATEAESVSIRQNFSDIFTEDGIAFYAYGANDNTGADVFRFRNKNVPGTYIFVLPPEASNIRQNFADVFEEEGVAFEVAI